MVIFNTLKLSNDEKLLIIDVSITSTSFEDRDQKIDQIWIDSKVPSYNGICPSKSKEAVLLATTDDPIYSEDKKNFPNAVIISNRVKVELKINTADLTTIDIIKKMCHIYVLTSGMVNSENDCSTSIATLVNFYPQYQRALSYIKDLEDTCSPHRDFIDFILKMKAVELAILTDNYTLAHTLWDRLNKELVVPEHCNCNTNGILY